MAPDISRLVDQHHMYYEVSAYYASNEIHKSDAAIAHQNVQAGFDIDLFGTGAGTDLKLSPESEQAHLTLHNLERVAKEIAPRATRFPTHRNPPGIWRFIPRPRPVPQAGSHGANPDYSFPGHRSACRSA